MQFKYFKMTHYLEVKYMNNIKLMEYLNCKKSKNFNEVLFNYIDQSGHKDSEIYNKVDIDRKLFSKIRCNNNYIPKKNTIIKLCLALCLKKEDFNKLLNSAGYSLSQSVFDNVILFCLENNIYDLDVINNYLYETCNTSL